MILRDRAQFISVFTSYCVYMYSILSSKFSVGLAFTVALRKGVMPQIFFSLANIKILAALYKLECLMTVERIFVL